MKGQLLRSNGKVNPMLICRHLNRKGAISACGGYDIGSRLFSFSSKTPSSSPRSSWTMLDKKLSTDTPGFFLKESRRYNQTSALKESYEFVNVERKLDAGVGWITLNRPSALNALSDRLFEDLIHAVRALDMDDEIGCMVLTGSTKAFAAGADISEMKDRSYEYAYQTNMFGEWAEVSRASKPIIAAVNGYALGGGCELAMLCDLIIASDTAQFGQPEILLGIIPGAGGTQRLPRAVGKSKAMLSVLTGDRMKADDAEKAGLVAKVVPSDELDTTVLEIATKIAQQGRMAVLAAKEAVNASQEMTLQEGLRFERRLFHALFATDDQKEGMSAFLEKRKPNFSNKK